MSHGQNKLTQGIGAVLFLMNNAPRSVYLALVAREVTP